MHGELIENRAARVAESEHTGDFVVGFAGGVVASAADASVGKFGAGRVAIRRGGRDMVENCVAAGDDEADSGHLRMARGEVRFENYGMNVAFQVIHGDERLVERQGENFTVGHADEERAGEAGPLSDGDGVEIGERDFCLVERFAHDWDDFAEMFARGELGDNAAVFAVDVDLRGDDAR